MTSHAKEYVAALYCSSMYKYKYCSLLCTDRYGTTHRLYLGKLQPFIIYPSQSLQGKISLRILNLADLSEAL